MDDLPFFVKTFSARYVSESVHITIPNEQRLPNHAIQTKAIIRYLKAMLADIVRRKSRNGIIGQSLETIHDKVYASRG